MIFGLLATAGGIFALLGGAIVKNAGDQNGLPGFGDVVGGAVAVIGIIVLVIGIVQILGGVGAWRGSEWGRVIGLIYGVLGFLLGLAAAAGARNAAVVTGSGAAAGLVIILIYGFIAVVLAIRWKVSAA